MIDTQPFPARAESFPYRPLHSQSFRAAKPNPSFAQKKLWGTYLASVQWWQGEGGPWSWGRCQPGGWKEASVMDPCCRAEQQLLTVRSKAKQNTKEKSSYNPDRQMIQMPLGFISNKRKSNGLTSSTKPQLPGKRTQEGPCIFILPLPLT